MLGRLASYLALTATVVICGIAVPFLGLYVPLLIVMGLMAVWVMADFRAGVVLALILIPISATVFFPHELFGLKGLNPLNVLLLVTVVSLFIQSSFRNPLPLQIPQLLIWCYIVPFGIAALIGSRHVSEIPMFFKVNNLISFDDSIGYVRDLFIKPLYLPIAAVLLAIAVRASARPERFVIAILVAGALPALLVLGTFANSGLSLLDLSGADARGFLSVLGMHANELALLFNSGYVLAIYTLGGVADRSARFALFALSLLFSVAVLITFSRAGVGVFATINIIYLIKQRRLKTLVLFLIAGLAITTVFWDALMARMLTGVEGGDRSAITAGRLDDIWLPLLSEAIRSPFLPHGISSVMWSHPVQKGTMLQVGQTHSAYLGLLYDYGVILGGLIAWFIWRLIGEFRRLARQDESPILRSFFGGATMAMLVWLLQGLSDDRFTPTYAQPLIWFSVGMLLGRGGFPSKTTRALPLAPQASAESGR